MRHGTLAFTDRPLDYGMRWLDAARTRLRLLLTPRAAEARMSREFEFHIEMETERLRRESGLDPLEARRQALATFGGVENYKEELRDGRGLAWLAGMSLDLKLGLRMLVKYPGLTIVGVVGMAVAVAIGAVAFAVVSTVIDSRLPLDQGDRIIAIQNLDLRRNDEGRQTHLHDLAVWREALSTVEQIGAYRTIDRNLITPGGRAEPARVAEMTASGFRVARVAPLLGRYFSADDEREGAPPVVVLGFDLWQNRFGGRPELVGSTIQLGATRHTVVGVMPHGFAFPINNRVWTPLRLDPSDFARGEAPRIDVFGRLAPGATLDDAQRQVTTIGQRLAAAHPETHANIRPRVLPYARAFIDSPELAWAFHLVQVLVSMLLVVIGTNVAILVYARTATRAGEIAVRCALGASRARVVMPLFAEAFVLSVAAAAVGVAAAGFGLEQIETFVSHAGGEQVPFWMHFRVTPGLIAYVAGLAVLAAVIVGVVPALKATRREVHANLQQLIAGGSGLRLGRSWTVLIVTQVAIAVAILPVALHGIGEWVRHEVTGPAASTKEFLTATLHLDREGTVSSDADTGDTRYAVLEEELVRRLEAEPGVSHVVRTSAVPGDEPSVRIETERAAQASDRDAVAGAAGRAVGVARVDLGFFAAFDVPILAGRSFLPGDADAAATAVIVNRSFVQQVIGGGDPLGRRVRRVFQASVANAQTSRWYEIVGVVPDFPHATHASDLAPRLYQPMLRDAGQPLVKRTVLRRALSRTQPMLAETGHAVTLAIRVRGAAPATFAGRLRELAVAVDPMLRLSAVATLDGTLREKMAVNRLIFLAVALMTLSVTLLSAGGIYALMSFTITRRRREIGIRSALGAAPRFVLAGVLSRAIAQIAVGITIGVAVAGLLDWLNSGGMLGGRGVLLLPAVAVLMATVGVLAALGPARRALRIQPTEALRAD